ncbi:multi-sensor hybrid histidine kinase [Gloeocapsa sp. PCC 7428]|uniref:hybrid sensor histidine kinase/response regulator n=1 Tax=Gloeocapsa sp. PCC 7428 TaxID=1173026 RepID=UPI0002A61BA0|nr:PAS domain-containing protein [Gloeocapsa sp. PCC 7428]AFZ30630.1 multi-sensor hybrid histidine kinase [Gloeocapsa sp. PCC 7428]
MTQRSPDPTPITPPIPANEAERLAALHRYQILDTPPEAAFDRITSLAARLFNAPIALVSLLDESRAWFKSGYGFEPREVERNDTICSFAVLSDDVLVALDTQQDPRFSCNPFVQSDPGVRCYIGAPLITHDGFNLGTLCLLDTQPREAFSLEQQAMLVDLAAIVVDELELRLAARQVAQQELAQRESEAQLQRALQIGKMGTWDWNLPTNKIIWSAGHFTLLGLQPDQCEPGYEVWLNSLHPEDREGAEAALQRAMTEQTEYRHEYRTVWQDGSIHWVEARGSFSYNASGQPDRMVGVLVDITERKQAEADLRESEARYRLLAEAIPQFVWITNPDGQNEYVNQQFCDYTGLTPQQMRGLDWLSIIHPDDLAMTRDRWLAAVKTGLFYEIEYRFRRADGTYRWFLGQGLPLKDEQGRVLKWFGTCTDIEPQKQIERSRLHLLEQEQAARASAEQANRIKDEFLAVLSHELRTPLNPILGWSRMLRSGNLDAAKTAHALETIERNAKLQTQLIEDLLDVSRILQGKFSLNRVPVDVAATISAALETVRLAAEAKSIQIQTNLDTSVGQVVGDTARLQQVVWNLLSNAVKFTPQGGQIEVELKQIGSQAQITVRDTGKGIVPEFLPHVFEYFRQADGATTRRFGGLGLGLAIVHHLVELHGGTVQADSPGEGQGATFTVRLPLMQVATLLRDEAHVPVSMVDDSPLTGIQILVVDDEADSREFVAFVLEQAGAVVNSVSSGTEALQTITQATPDLVVSDIGMPEMDGYMLLQQIRSQESGKQVPAIALTAYAGEYDRQQALQAGFHQHLSKPIEPNELIESIVNLKRKATRLEPMS